SGIFKPPWKCPWIFCNIKGQSLQTWEPTNGNPNRNKTLKMSEEDPFSKTSFPPISDADTEILILGSLPGDLSLKVGEYFAHPRNRFWKIIAAITNEALPQTYPEKLELLHRNRIGLWNVLHKASRKGSLDSAISDEIPNDLPA